MQPNRRRSPGNLHALRRNLRARNVLRSSLWDTLLCHPGSVRRGWPRSNAVESTDVHVVPGELLQSRQLHLGRGPALDRQGLRVVRMVSVFVPGDDVAGDVSVPGLTRGDVPRQEELTGSRRLDLQVSGSFGRLLLLGFGYHGLGERALVDAVHRKHANFVGRSWLETSD